MWSSKVLLCQIRNEPNSGFHVYVLFFVISTVPRNMKSMAYFFWRAMSKIQQEKARYKQHIENGTKTFTRVITLMTYNRAVQFKWNIWVENPATKKCLLHNDLRTKILDLKHCTICRSSHPMSPLHACGSQTPYTQVRTQLVLHFFKRFSNFITWTQHRGPRRKGRLF